MYIGTYLIRTSLKIKANITIVFSHCMIFYLLMTMLYDRDPMLVQLVNKNFLQNNEAASVNRSQPSYSVLCGKIIQVDCLSFCAEPTIIFFPNCLI